MVSNANEVGAALSADPRVHMISFTGSTATGWATLAAGATVKKTLLELGGKSAHIVLDDADFSSALPLAAMMACAMSGQSCILPPAGSADATAPKASWNTSNPRPSACPTETTTVDIQQISDRLEIAALLNRCARAVDTKD